MENKMNTVDVIVALLKGGHITEKTPVQGKSVYTVFMPMPNPPHNKTYVGHITEKQLNELCSKGIAEPNTAEQRTDKNNNIYSFYRLAAEYCPKKNVTNET